MKIRFVCATIAVCVFGVWSAQIVAQATMSIASRADERVFAGALDRPVTIKLDEVPLEAAVRAVAESAGVRISYRVALLRDVPKLVTFQANGVKLGITLEHILLGTNLYVVASGEDVLSIRQGAMAQRVLQGTIVGKVLHAKTKKPIPGATIVFGDPSRHVTADADGAFRISAATGEQRIAIRAVGFARQIRDVTVREGETANLDVLLDPATSVLDEVVVTGTVVATERKAIPNAITVITARQIQERGITRIEQLFRGDVPGLFAMNLGSLSDAFGRVTLFSRGASDWDPEMGGAPGGTPMKTYVDGIELADPGYISKIDMRSVDRIEILTGPQASTIYGSNAINGVIQIFTKRGASLRPELSASVISGLVQNNFSAATTPVHTYDARIRGTDGRWSYSAGGSWDYTGAWTPASQQQGLGVDGALRVEMGVFTVDGSARRAQSRNHIKGDVTPGYHTLAANGTFARSSSASGERVPPSRATLDGQTFGVTVRYAIRPWWSHDLTLGADESNTRKYDLQPGFTYDSPPEDYGDGFVFPGFADTALNLTETTGIRYSQRYTTSARIPLPVVGALSLSLGGDRWKTRSSQLSGNGTSLSPNIPGAYVNRSKSKNGGLFFQGQLDVRDALFFTYGVRAEWSPYYGEDQQPQVNPRYGVAYVREFGALTAKVRASFGPATRPPSEGQRDGLGYSEYIPIYGTKFATLPNPDLGPEFSKGGEGGLELYFGNRGSVVVTRYNQTVDGLIAYVNGVDSVRSLRPSYERPCYFNEDLEQHCWLSQSMILNVGAIRNQGWELQGTLNVGPLALGGAYSWTTSRMIGVTPRYRELLEGNSFGVSQYHAGYSFSGVAEHTWSANIRYAHRATAVSLNLNGVGQIYQGFDRNMVLMNGAYRFQEYASARFGYPMMYRSKGEGYAMADLNASHRLSTWAEGVLHMSNVSNFYQNDWNTYGAVMGRQTRVGIRITWR